MEIAQEIAQATAPTLNEQRVQWMQRLLRLRHVPLALTDEFLHSVLECRRQPFVPDQVVVPQPRVAPEHLP